MKRTGRCGHSNRPRHDGPAPVLAVGVVVSRELPLRVLANCVVQAASRSGLVLFICAAAQSLAFMLTIQQIPHPMELFMIHLSHTARVETFLLVSIAILIVMRSVLEGATALILFGLLLVPVATQIGIDPLQFGIVLVLSMGIGLFAPPIDLGLLLVCLLVIAFVPAIATTFPRAFGY